MAAESTEQSEPQNSSIEPTQAVANTATLEAETPTAAAVGKPAAADARVKIRRRSAHELIAAFEASQLRDDLPEIFVGDTVRVGVRIREGNKERVQPYEGVVIAKRHGEIGRAHV